MDQGDSQQLAPRTYRSELTEVQRQDPDEIRREIEYSRRQIAQSLGQLRSEVSHTVERALDWRQWVHDHPHTTVGIAFGLGFYLAIR